MNCYVVSHNGLGDNLYMIGGITYLSKFYEHVYFLCKQKYYNNVKLFFVDGVTCVPFNQNNNEYIEIKNIIQNKYEDNDVFICGECHRHLFPCKITNQTYIDSICLNKDRYDIQLSNITNQSYSFIEGFYNDMKLNLSYFYEYFEIPDYKESRSLFENVNMYYIIFVQNKCSSGQKLNIENLVDKYINNKKSIIVCVDENVYPIGHSKHVLAQKFVMKEVVYYKDTIKNSDEIHLIDSCFLGIILPYAKTNRLKTNNINIHLRD